jgi:hypothetical protein
LNLPGTRTGGSDTTADTNTRNPGQVVAEVAARRPLCAGDVVLALVRDSSGDQKVVRVRSIPSTRRQGLDRYERSQLLADYAESLRVPRRGTGESPWHSIMTIVARRDPGCDGGGERREDPAVARRRLRVAHAATR